MTIPKGEHLELGYLGGGVTVSQPGSILEPRILNDFEFVWIMAGDHVCWHDRTESPATPDTIILARPGVLESYIWDRRKPGRHVFFHFSILALPEDWPELDTWPTTRKMVTGDTIRPLFRHVLEHWCFRHERNWEPPTPAITRTIATMIDQFVERDTQKKHSLTNQYPRAVQLAVDRIHTQLISHPEKVLTLEELAKNARVSPSHLIRLFRQNIGMTPIKVMKLMRLDQSIALLERSNLNISEIADKLGFASVFHFSRLFSQTYAMSPTKMRQQIMAGGIRPSSQLPIDSPPIDVWYSS